MRAPIVLAVLAGRDDRLRRRRRRPRRHPRPRPAPNSEAMYEFLAARRAEAADDPGAAEAALKRAVALDPAVGGTARRAGRLLRPPEPRRRCRRRRRAGRRPRCRLRGRPSHPRPGQRRMGRRHGRGAEGRHRAAVADQGDRAPRAHPELAGDGHRPGPADDAGPADHGVGRRGESDSAARAHRRPGRQRRWSRSPCSPTRTDRSGSSIRRRPRSSRPRKPTHATTSPSATFTSGKTSGKRRLTPTRRASAPPAAVAASCACAGPRRC